MVRDIRDSLKLYLRWCLGNLLLSGSRYHTVKDMIDAISDEIASGGGGISQDQLDQAIKDVTKAYGIADQTVLTSAEQYTDQKIADVVDGSPEALDTLYELAKALGDDPNFATTVTDLIGQKLPTTTFEDFVTNKAWTKDNLTKLSQLVNDLHSLKVAGHSVDLVEDKLYLDNVDEFFNTKNLTSLSQLINDINSIKAGTRVESMDVDLASISSYLRYDLFDSNTTGTKPPGLTTGFLLTFSWDNGGWGAQIATSDGNVDGAIFLRTIKASGSDKVWGPWVSLYNTANFNPDDYLPKTTPTINSGTVIDGLSNVGNLPFLRFHIPGVNYSQFVMDENGTVHLLNGSEQTPGTYKPLKAGPIFSNGNRVWDAGNLGNATTSQAGLMSSADKIKLDGLSDQINVVGQASSTYIFPGDPSELDSSSSSTHITLILGTASDFLDAFNNGKVFVSKTVTFSGVSVPSDITYNVLKSEDPDNPTIFSIIMSTVVWCHYIEITIDFENNEYQAITGTINGRISVNTTGTSN